MGCLGWLCPWLGLAWGAPWGQPRPSSLRSGQIVKKSCYPRWNETFEFELEEGTAEALCVEAWDWDLVSRNDFLGKVSALLLLAAPATTSEPGLHAGTPSIPSPHQLPQRGTPTSHWCSGTPRRDSPKRKSSWQGRELRVPAPAWGPASALPPGGVQCPESVGGPAGGGLVPATARPVQDSARRVSAWAWQWGWWASGPKGWLGADSWLQQAGWAGRLHRAGRPLPIRPDSVILAGPADWPFSQPWTQSCPLSSEAVQVSCFLPSGRFWNRPSDFFPLRVSQQTLDQSSSPQSSDSPPDFPEAGCQIKYRMSA